MLETAFLFWSVPFIYLLPWSHKKLKRYTYSILKLHILLSVSLAMLYVWIRSKYCANFKDLSQPVRSNGVREFYSNGCRMLLFKPIRPSKRRILLFPGLGISVRRMLQESCMSAFVDDSEIVCFQIRGIGESEWCVDLCAKSMLEDAQNAYVVFDSLTNGDLKTLFVGFSLGCFVSMQLLGSRAMICRKCDNVLLVNGMCSGHKMVFHFKMFAKLLSVNVKPYLRSSDVPITILHAKDDVTIPIDESIEMKEECDLIGRSCQILTCEGDHGRYEISNDTQAILRRL